MKVKKQSVAFILGMIVLLAGTGTLMITAMREIKVKMNVSANTTLLNTTRMISDSLLNNFSSDQQQLETCANLFSRLVQIDPAEHNWASAKHPKAGEPERCCTAPGIGGIYRSNVLFPFLFRQ